MTNKHALVAFIAILCQMVSYAQGSIDKLQVQTRFDHQREWIDSDPSTGASGFKGKYFNVRLDGSYSNLTYSIRQRMNRAHANASYFDATDWAWINWSFSDRFSINAGKQVVAIGGFEYDRAPIDLFQCSEFWNNIPCYQLGLSASLLASDNDKLTFQFCQSPNRAAADDMYAYNLVWYGSHGFWSSIWSANLIESLPGKYMTYLALGNKFSSGGLSLELDLMQRIPNSDMTLFDDCSVMAELSYNFCDRVNIFGKYTYDANDSNSLDFCVLKGTRINRAGAGIVYFPMKDSQMLRLHLQAGQAFGNNSNIAGTILDGQLFLDFGFTFNLDVLSALK